MPTPRSFSPAPARESTRARTGETCLLRFRASVFGAPCPRAQAGSDERNIVYAGTTEGLWKTIDLGKVWKRVSNPEVVVNDVLIDPRDSNRVLLATDRSGVMASTDGASNWTPSNQGYAHRYVSAILADNRMPAPSTLAWLTTANTAACSIPMTLDSTGCRKLPGSAAKMFSRSNRLRPV